MSGLGCSVRVRVNASLKCRVTVVVQKNDRFLSRERAGNGRQVVQSIAHNLSGSGLGFRV